ncbi:MAG: heavy-metal-associated domain-containing protein [Nanoarchaeota archaeon]|nr:heavy-metal-associated domain-containing protein [Nanoarchaeota archaeon]
MKSTIYVPDIECDSCVKVIDRKLKELQGIEGIEFKPDAIEVAFNEALLKPENIVTMIKNSGFRASTEPFDRKTITERFRDFRENRHKYAIEWQGVKYTFYTLFILIAFELLLYSAFFRGIPNFWQTYGIWLFYLNLSIVTIGAALWHFKAYRAKVTCMVGMMIGMIIGMQAGMMVGAIIGATNGFFVGAMTGMLLGVGVGAIAGNCCGIMGILQGMMAGLMGGTMGPMISLMMFSDNLHIFMPFYMAINILILAGFSYMVIEEVVENRKVERKPVDFQLFAAVSLIASAGLTLLMLYAPKSAFLG